MQFSEAKIRSGSEGEKQGSPNTLLPGVEIDLERGDEPDTRRQYHSLGEALHRAGECGSEETARYLAQAAARLLPEVPYLAEPLVRYHLNRDEADIALLLLEGLPLRPATIRLMRCVVLLRLGRRDEAHLDLMGWSRQSALPPEARTLLGLLDWGLANHVALTDHLRNSFQEEEHPDSLILRMLRADHRTQISRWAERLRAIDSPPVDQEVENLILESVGQKRREAPVGEAPGEVQQLARELVGGEIFISTLVRAQTLRFDREEATLIARALEYALPELRTQGESCADLIRLFILLDDRASARRWLSWGMREHSRSIALLRVREEFAELCREDEIAPTVLASINADDQRSQAA